MDRAKLDLFTTSSLKEHSTYQTHNGHMQWSCTNRDVCVSCGAKHTTEFNGAEEKIINRKELFTQKTVYEQRRKKLSGKRSQRKWDRMGMMTCLDLNIWPVSWSSPAAGAMRMYGVVSWVTIIAAKAKEEFQVSMHEGKKSQTEATPARRILVSSLLSELVTNKTQKNSCKFLFILSC